MECSNTDDLKIEDNIDEQYEIDERISTSLRISRYSSLHAHHTRSMEVLDRQLPRTRSSTGGSRHRKLSISVSSTSFPLMLDINGGSCDDLINMASPRVADIINPLKRTKSSPLSMDQEKHPFRQSITGRLVSYFLCGVPSTKI